jgi:hypothetical protein
MWYGQREYQYAIRNVISSNIKFGRMTGFSADEKSHGSHRSLPYFTETLPGQTVTAC